VEEWETERPKKLKARVRAAGRGSIWRRIARSDDENADKGHRSGRAGSGNNYRAQAAAAMGKRKGTHMSKVLIWKDSRLTANDIAPWDNTTVMFVGPTTPLAEMVADSAGWAQQNAGDYRYLMIYCHGGPGYLQICKEGISLKNVTRLAPLSPYFDSVDIHACLIAKGQAGRAFCSKLAGVLVAPVAGAVSLQYNTGPWTIHGWVDDGKYDGDYYLHDPAGARSGPLRSDAMSGGIVHPYSY
jgi:hypothetical protein